MNKYIVSFFITLLIFGSGVFLGNYQSEKRIQKIQSLQDDISADLLSSELQFSLLGELPCTELHNGSLTKELNELSLRLGLAEQNRNKSAADVLVLRKKYMLLQIQDMLLNQRVEDRCEIANQHMIYFYSEEDCDECRAQWKIITQLRDDYPDLRVYTFDTSADIAAINALQTLYSIEKSPSIILGTNKFEGLVKPEKLLEVLGVEQTLIEKDEEIKEEE